jgi:hypothetical protein
MVVVFPAGEGSIRVFYLRDQAVLIVGKFCGAPGPVAFTGRVAVGVVVEGGCPAQGVGGGQCAVQSVDFMDGYVAQRILFAYQQVVVVEPVAGAAAGGVEG